MWLFKSGELLLVIVTKECENARGVRLWLGVKMEDKGHKQRSAGSLQELERARPHAPRGPLEGTQLLICALRKGPQPDQACGD